MYRFKTKKLTGASCRKIIEAFILQKCKNASAPLEILISDEDDGFVTMDQDYLDEYNPFASENVDGNTTQSISLPATTVKLRVLLPSKLVDKRMSF